jgi:hypothetical protein
MVHRIMKLGKRMLAKNKIYLAKSDTAQYLDLKTYNRNSLIAGAPEAVRIDIHTI